MTTLIISNKEMKDIQQIVKHLQESVLLVKCVIEKIENEVFLLGALGSLGSKLFTNALSDKQVLELLQELLFPVKDVIFNAALSFN